MINNLEQNSIEGFKVQKYSDYSLWPALDYKLKNIGDEVAIVNRVILEILKIELDQTPKLYFQLLPQDNHDLLLRVVNLGWGSADNIEFKFWNENITSLIDGNELDYFWKGAITDYVDIIIPATKKTTKKVTISPGDLKGSIKFYDSKGKQYEQMVKYDTVPRYRSSDWRLIVSPKGFEIEILGPKVLFSLMRPSGIYDVLLTPQKTPFKKEVNISQVIGPNEGDRFQIVIASECSADYLIKSHVEVDGSVVHVTEPAYVSVKFDKYLPNLFYREGLSIDLNEASQIALSEQASNSDRNDKRDLFQY